MLVADSEIVLFIVRMFMYGLIANMLRQRGPRAAACRLSHIWNDMSHPLWSALLGAVLRKETARKAV